MEIIEGGVTAAQGFFASSTQAGIKYKDRKDMAMITSQVPCRAAGVFTKNVVKAAPVLWDKKVIAGKGPVQAVVVNSGIANACTGEPGFLCCEQTARAVERVLAIPAENVLVCSPGVIGMQMPVEKITAGVEKMAAGLEASLEAGKQAAEAIMTTDTVSKEVAVRLTLGGKTVTLGGMCKGSGMIHPNMGTMLAFVTTDAAISTELLQEALGQDVEDTFNMVSVDGDTSTNDTLLVLANGCAGNKEICTRNEDYFAFLEALHYINETLSKKIAGDGEGATALFEAKVVGADTKEHARLLAKSVITSSLTKAAIFGHDANWGRILCALGYAGADFDPDKIELYLESGEEGILIFQNGQAADYREEDAGKLLSQPYVRAVADMKMGECSATAWGCDLTYEYVKINADYRS